MRVALPRVLASSDQLAFITSIAVEWSYKNVEQSFEFQDFARKLQVMKGHVAMLCIICVHLSSIKTVLGHTTQAESTSSCSPPTLERYLEM